MRFLLRPGWIAFALFVIGFAVACYTVLAPWQFRRNAERAEQNREITASFAHPPAPLAQLLPPGTVPTPAIQWRQAVVRGQYLPTDEAVVRLRTVDGNPAFEVLTAFRTDDGRLIAVDRGYVRPGEGRQVMPFPPAPAGEVSLTGRIRLDETDPQHRASFVDAGHHQLYAASSQLLGQVVGQRVDPGYLQLVDNQPGGLGVLPLPDTDSGPFLSYAWQWLTFGAMALFGLGYFIRLEILQRRAPAESDSESEGEGTEEEHEPALVATEAAPDDPGRGRGSVRHALSSARTGRAALRAALRDPDWTPEQPATPADTPRPAQAPKRAPSEPDRDRLIERYGKARF